MKQRSSFLICGSLLALIPLRGYSQKQSFNPPSGFIENKGQIVDQYGAPNHNVLFLLPGERFNVQLRKNGFSYDAITYTNSEQVSASGLAMSPPIPNAGTAAFNRIDIELVNSSNSATIQPAEASNMTLNYYGTHTATGVEQFTSIRYQNIYPNIDMEFSATGSSASPVKYNFILHPGANIRDIELAYHGNVSAELQADGIQLELGEQQIKEFIPKSYYEDSHKPILVSYTVLSNGHFGLVPLGDLDSQRSVVIDPMPILLWGTFFGEPSSGLSFQLWDIDSDLQGNVYITGYTGQTNTIATTGAYQDNNVLTGEDGFIAKLSADGQTKPWATYFGGTGLDVFYGIRVFDQGQTPCLYATGFTTSSSGIAALNGFTGPNSDVLIAKFSLQGAFLWARYVGGSGWAIELATDVAIDANGNPCITGSTESPDFPMISTTWQSTMRGVGDGFIVKMNPAGSILWSTYYGGSNSFADDIGRGICTDPSGNIAITGYTYSTNYISSDGTTYVAQADAYFASFSPSGTRLWGTYLGGSGDDLQNFHGIASDANGNILSVGMTTSTNFPTLGYSNAISGGQDAYMVKYNSSGTKQWCRLFGGNDPFPYADGLFDLAVTSVGDFFCVGTSSATGLSTAGALQSTFTGSASMLICKFDGAGVNQWCSYFGDNTGSGLSSMCYRNGRVYVSTINNPGTAAAIATPGAYQSALSEGYVACFAEEDCLGVPGGSALPGTPCDDGNAGTIDDTYDFDCNCVGTFVCNVLDLVIYTDANGGQTWWEIQPAGGGTAIVTGGLGGAYASNSTIVEHPCLPDGCYELIFHDTGGNGMCCASGLGGYVLFDPNGYAIIDNRDDSGNGNGDFLSTSTVSCSPSFCLPLGPITLTTYPTAQTAFLGRVTANCAHIGTPLKAFNTPAIASNYPTSSTNYGYSYQVFDPDGSNTASSHRFDVLIPSCGSSLTTSYCRGTYMDVHGSSGQYMPGAATSPANEQYTWFNPRNFQTGSRVSRNIWLNLRVAQRLGTTPSGNFGPVSRVKYVDPPPFQSEPERTLIDDEGNFTVEMARLRIYPNPTQDGYVHFELDAVPEETSLLSFEIIDARGRVIRQGNVLQGGQSISQDVDLKSASRGLYLLRLTVGSETLMRAFSVN